MEITKLSRQKRSERINVYIDDKYSFSLDEASILKYNLYLGKKITKDESFRLERQSIIDKLYSYSLDLISRRPRSSKEIKQKLLYKLQTSKTTPKIDKDEKDTLAESVIEKLKRDNYLNDEDFAAWWIRNRLNIRPRGVYLLRKELLQKGVNPEIINTQLTNLYPTDDSTLIRKEFEKKKRSLKNLPAEKRYNKMLSFLLRKGFKYDRIIYFFREIGFK